MDVALANEFVVDVCWSAVLRSLDIRVTLAVNLITGAPQPFVRRTAIDKFTQEDWNTTAE